MLRLAIVCDLLEEGWPSMDLVGEMLHHQLSTGYDTSVAAQLVRPPMRYRFSSGGRARGRRFNSDRLLNRFWYYPRLVERAKDRYDIFHVVDHSYGQLVHNIPAGRTVVTCHDLDTFRCLLAPDVEPRSKLFRAMTRRVLDGFQKAARVTCDSVVTRNELLEHGLFPPERLVVVHNGVAPIYSPVPDSEAEAEVSRMLGPSHKDAVELLHVGSTVGRKRVDILLRVFAAVRREVPRARLIRVGGDFTEAQLRLVESLKLGDAVTVLPFVEKRILAAVYRRAALVLQPSEREGFGLPIIEAMACGTPVVASDLAVLREVGAGAVTYVKVGDVPAWKEAMLRLLKVRQDDPTSWARMHEASLNQAAKFSWSEYTRKMVALYHGLL